MSDPRKVKGDPSEGEVGPEVFVGEPEVFNGAGTIGSDRPEKSGTSVPLLTIVAIVALLAGAAGGVFFSQGTYDSSTEKRLEYACVLIKEVGQTHPSAEDWGDFEDPAYADVVAAAGLLGGFMPAADDDDKTWQLGTGSSVPLFNSIHTH